MSTQQSKDLTQVAQGIIEAFNADDWARFKAPLVANVIYEETGTQRRVQDADAYVQLCQGWKQAFPMRRVLFATWSALATPSFRNSSGREHKMVISQDQVEHCQPQVDGSWCRLPSDSPFKASRFVRFIITST